MNLGPVSASAPEAASPPPPPPTEIVSIVSYPRVLALPLPLDPALGAVRKRKDSPKVVEGIWACSPILYFSPGTLVANGCCCKLL